MWSETEEPDIFMTAKNGSDKISVANEIGSDTQGNRSDIIRIRPLL